jgi:hypothetical protein
MEKLLFIEISNSLFFDGEENFWGKEKFRH